MSQAITEKPVLTHHAANAWTLDADSQQQVNAASRFIEAGISAITTNRPTLLAKPWMGRILEGGLLESTIPIKGAE